MFGNVLDSHLLAPPWFRLSAYHHDLPGRLGFTGETRGHQAHE